MGNELWDINDEYAPPRYVLAGGQRAYIDPNSKKYEKDPAKAENAINRTIEILAQRFQDLFDDITLLDFGGYTEGICWEKIIDIESRAEYNHRSEVFLTHRDRTVKEIQFGFELGGLIHVLAQEPRNDDFATELVWGFILGLIGRDASQGQEEKREINQLIDGLKREMSSRQNLIGRDRDLLDHLTKIQDTQDDIIAEKLEEYGIIPTPQLIGSIKMLLKGTSTTEDKVETLVQNILAKGNLRIADQLYREALRDAETVSQDNLASNISGLNIDDCLRILFQSNTAIQTAEVASRAGLSTGADHLSTGLLDRLCRTEGKIMWTKYPLVKRTNTGWRLTNYGSLVCMLLFEQSPPRLSTETLVPELMSVYALAEEEMNSDERQLIKKAIEEIRN